jgi:hypothetical protein
LSARPAQSGDKAWAILPIDIAGHDTGAIGGGPPARLRLKQFYWLHVHRVLKC